MPVVGRLIGLKVDARWLIAAGLLIMTAGSTIGCRNSTSTSAQKARLFGLRVVLVLGLSICFAPANVAAYLYTPLALRGAAVGLLSLLRNEGGNCREYPWRRPSKSGVINFTPCGLASPSILLTRPWLLSSSRLRRGSCNRPAIRWLRNNWRCRRSRMLREQQASSLSFFDVFWMAAVLTFVVAVAVLFMKRSVAEKAARVGSE